MTGQSFGNLMNSGRKHTAMSNQNRRTGPSNKNLGPRRGPSGAGPTSTLKGGITRPIKGPDKGAG
jgi:hypothetical protein